MVVAETHLEQEGTMEVEIMVVQQAAVDMIRTLLRGEIVMVEVAVTMDVTMAMDEILAQATQDVPRTGMMIQETTVETVACVDL